MRYRTWVYALIVLLGFLTVGRFAGVSSPEEFMERVGETLAGQWR